MDFWKAFKIRPVIASDDSIQDLELTWTSSLSNEQINCLQVEDMSSSTESDPIYLSVQIIKNSWTGNSFKFHPRARRVFRPTRLRLTRRSKTSDRKYWKKFSSTSIVLASNILEKLIEHEIELNEAGKMKDLPMYRYSPKMLEKIDEELERWKNFKLSKNATQSLRALSFR